MLTVRGQQHSFSTHERVFCKSFWDRKCRDLRGTRTSIHRTLAECSNHLGYKGQAFVVPFFNTGSGGIDIILSTLNICNINCALATAFIFDTRKVFLWKCQNFWDKKSLDPRGTRTANLHIHAECSNHLSYRSHTFAAPCFHDMIGSMFYFHECRSRWGDYFEHNGHTTNQRINQFSQHD